MRKEAQMVMARPSSSAAASLPRNTLRFAVVAAVLGCLFGLAPLSIPHAQGADTNHLRIGAKSYGGTYALDLGISKSLIIDLPAEVHEVIVSQPAVAGAIMRSKRRAIIQGVGPGDTNIFFLDAAGEAITVLELSVAAAPSNIAAQLEATLRDVLPGSSIVVNAVDDASGTGSRVVLSGDAQSGDDITKAIAIAAQFAGGADNVASVITTSAPQQVMLKVTIAEVNRDTAKQLGINISSALNLNGVTTALINNRGLDAGSATADGGPGRFDVSFDAGPLSIDASLRALESRNAVRFLAEPTLTALSGQPADFLVGGQFPIQTRDPATGIVTTEFKDFGVKLGFTPAVRSDGIIGLTVSTEVSEIVSALGQLTVRRANTTVELPTGTTLAIGGLLQDTVRQQINKMPGLGDIPILGALFRSRDFIQRKTELVILVTPYLAFPGDMPTVPTDNYVVAGDAEAIFLGHLEALYGVGEDGMRGGYDGSVGFVLD
jgi:pilus assembly protein CpaC